MRSVHTLQNRALLFLLLLALLLTLTAGCTPKQEPQTVSFTAMDTFMQLTIYGGSEDLLQQAENRVLDLESHFSVTEPDSDISMLNNTGSGTVSPDTADLLSKALDLCADTDGALDITIYPLVKAWGFTTGEYQVPAPETLDQLLPEVGFNRVSLYGTSVSLPDGMEIDLGSVAKGYTGDVLADLFRSQGISSALLELGGNIHALGSKPDGSSWRVAIQDPQDLENYVGVVEVADKAVVTSGGYQRYFEEDGVRYWHILDPKTGQPARSGLLSVSIVGNSGLRCDALSTALFVMGPDQAISYWQAHRDFEAVLVLDDGSIIITSGLKDHFSQMGEHELTVVE